MKSPLKKLVLKTALITLGVTLIVTVSVFGIVSFCAPKAMMEFTANLGMDSISGDYAYEEFLHSGDLDCLARSFFIAADRGEDAKADERFEKLRAAETFEAFCEGKTFGGGEIPDYDFRDYLFGQAACVKYRRAQTDAARAEAADFALGETKESFPSGCPAVVLAVEVASREDAETCRTLLRKLGEGNFEHNAQYESIVRILGKYDTIGG